MSVPEPSNGESALTKPLDDSSPIPEASASTSPVDRRCGILTRADIKALNIIQEANEECFKPSSYDLRIGRQCVHVQERKGGFRNLETQKSVSLEPFDRLYFETCEVVKLPLDVAGRFDLRVHFAIKGLFVQVGTQVEPGYKGKLFGLIINTSSDPVDVFANQTLLTIEFHYLSGPVPSADVPDPCYSLTTFLRSRGIGESKYKKASVIGDIDHRVDELKKELGNVRQGWQLVSVLTGLLVTFFALFVSMLIWLVPPAVHDWVGEEVRRQQLLNQNTDTPTSESAQQAPATQPDAPAQEAPETQVDAPGQEADRTEGQGQ